MEKQFEIQKPVSRPGTKKQLVMILFILLSFAGLLAGGYFFFSPKEQTYTLNAYMSAPVQRGKLRETLQATGTLMVRTREALVAPEYGIVEGVFVKPGEKVARGQLLLTLYARDLDDRIFALEGELLEEGMEKERLSLEYEIRRGTLGKEAELLAAELSRRETAFGYAKSMYESNYIARIEMEQAQKEMDAARREYEEQGAEEKILALNHDFSMKLLDARISRMETELTGLKKERDTCSVRSPIEGTVLELPVKPGMNVRKSEELALVADLASSFVIVGIQEKQIEKVQKGQEAWVTIGGTVYPALVRYVSLVSGNSPDGSAVVDTELEFSTPPVNVVVGSAVSCEITLGEKDDALYLPRGEYLSTGNQRQVYVIKENKAVKREVSFGLFLDKEIEVLSGLAEGEQVIVSGYHNFFTHDWIELKQGGGKVHD